MKITTEINILWTNEDVQGCAKDWDDEKPDILTDEQCGRVLDSLDNNHDASIGINWDTIDYYIKEIQEEDANKLNTPIGIGFHHKEIKKKEKE